MEIGHIAGSTRTLGKPKGWDEEKQGKCYGLPVLDAIMTDGHNVMISAWLPTKEELEMLNAGETVKLWIYGTSHPVVSITVGEVE